jgi:C_GCAxxG_C_C family probable redox protein
MNREDRAIELYNQGCNCSQAVFCAFAEEEDMDKKSMFLLASPFGSGMGGLGETCGALSGLFMAMGLKYGFDPSVSKEIKEQFYTEIHSLGVEFRSIKGSTRCNELLEIHKDRPRPEINGKPVKRCEHIVREAARLGEVYCRNQTPK